MFFGSVFDYEDYVFVLYACRSVICTDSLQNSIQPKKTLTKSGSDGARGQIYTEEIWMITHHESPL